MVNPFTLTFGKKPLHYIDRLKDTQTIIESFTQEPASEQVYIITGLRGSGKTVLLSSITKKFLEEDDWIVADLNSEKDLLEGLASELYQNGKVKSLFLKAEFSFSFHGLSFSLHGDEPVLTAEALIKKMLDRIKAKGKKVLITIDDVASNEYMRVFAKTFQSLIRFDYPVCLLMTGLFENICKLQDDKSLTFLYRAPKIYLSPLDLVSVSESYQKAFELSFEQASKLAALTNGYAYAYQVLGFLLFRAGKKQADQAILSQYDQYLREFVYDKLWSELSMNEQKILKSIPSAAAMRTNDLLNVLGFDNPYFSVYRDSLTKKGILYSPSYGYLRFVLPRFSEFVSAKTLLTF
jgi:hypothetical protein